MKVTITLGARVLVGLVLAVLPRSAWAIDDSVTSTARALAQEGERDFKEGRYEQASSKFLKAYKAVRVPTLARSAARALVQQGRLVAASELYRQAGRLQPNELWMGNVQQNAQTLAAQELSELLPRIPRLKIVIDGASSGEVEVSIDGGRVPDSLVGVDQYVDPGQRRVMGKRGVEVSEQTVVLKEAEQKRVVLKFASPKPGATIPMTAVGGSASNGAPAQAGAVSPTGKALGKASTSNKSAANSPGNVDHASASGNGQRTWGWVSLGVGAAGLALGATTGLIVATKHSGLSTNCDNNACDPNKTDQGTLDTYNTLRHVSTVGFIVGAVGAAAGVTLLLTSSKPDKPNVGLWLAPGTAGLNGAF